MSEFLEWGYLGLALCAFLAGTPIPMNSEVCLSLALANGWPVIPCMLSCIVGNWLGATTNYFLGRLCTYEQLLKWTKANPERLQKVRNFLNGKGAWFALGSSLMIVGNLIIIGLSLNMIKVTKFRVMNMVPAIFLPILFCLFGFLDSIRESMWYLLFSDLFHLAPYPLDPPTLS